MVVHDHQLSLAIGKEGQNARLAARLTGWRIDIKSETQLADEEAGYAGENRAEGEWIQNEAGEMVFQPAGGGEAISMSEWESTGGSVDEASLDLSSRSTPPQWLRPRPWLSTSSRCLSSRKLAKSQSLRHRSQRLSSRPWHRAYPHLYRLLSTRAGTGRFGPYRL